MRTMQTSLHITVVLTALSVAVSACGSAADGAGGNLPSSAQRTPDPLGLAVGADLAVAQANTAAAIANQTATVAWGHVTETAVAPTVWAQSTSLAIGSTATTQYLQLQSDAATSTAVAGNAFMTSTAESNATAMAAANLNLTATAIPQATALARQEALNENRFQAEQTAAAITPWLPWLFFGIAAVLFIIAFFAFLPRAVGLLEAKELRMRTFRGPVTHVVQGSRPVSLASTDRMAQPVIRLEGAAIHATGGVADEATQAQIAALAAIATVVSRLSAVPPSVRRELYTQLTARAGDPALPMPTKLAGLIAGPNGPMMESTETAPIEPFEVPAKGVISEWLDEAEDQLNAHTDD